VIVDPKLLRPAEAALLIGDAPKAKTQLGWQLTVFFKELIHMRVNADLKRLSQARNSVPEAHDPTFKGTK
jgi:GDPmannose 4,6-dehydratase